MTTGKIQVALVDDHILLRKGLAGMIDLFGEYKVIMEADHGQQFSEMVVKGNIPDLVLMDINMPLQDGFETAAWLRNNYPAIKVLALSMYDSEPSIIKMLRNGARGYLLKDTDPQEFKRALDGVVEKGYYYSEIVSGKLIHAINNFDTTTGTNTPFARMSDKETEFLKLACTELTYKEIADQMHMSPRTIDGYRDALFERLGVKTRVGLVLFAIKNRIVMVD